MNEYSSAAGNEDELYTVASEETTGSSDVSGLPKLSTSDQWNAQSAEYSEGGQQWVPFEHASTIGHSGM